MAQGDAAGPQSLPAPTQEELALAPAQVAVQPIAHDEEIRTRLQSVMEATGWFNAPRVQVVDGVVFLSGRAESDEIKKWAGDLARNTQDVVAVANRIDVAQRTRGRICWGPRPARTEAMNRLRLLWSHLRSSLWFLPSLIVAFSVLLAVAVIQVDAVISGHWLARWPRLFGAGAAGARGMLSTIAGSMMSVVGVTFSMTLVALAMASSQYTSRILRNFMSSRLTQAVLGIFSGIFTYCLIVLRTIRGGDEGAFVPHLSVFFGFVLAVGGVGVLIFFIHHVASSIQASSIIASVAHWNRTRPLASGSSWISR